MKNGNMYCLDNLINPVLWGNDLTDNYQRFDILYLPCGYNATAVCTHTQAET
jgi:hypothetical protein